MNASKRQQQSFLFLVLAALFIAALVVTNLVANKFVEVPLGFKTFVISAGVLPYPITFLITDILSEIYGRRKTNQVVMAGFFASLFVLLTLWLGGIFNAVEFSPVNNETFDTVFAQSWRVITSSMLAYLVAQFVDVRIYHFWKKLTNGKHLWLRNNASTVLSQLLDTSLVVFVLFVGKLDSGTMLEYIRDGWFYKVIFAFADTAVLYVVIYGIRKYFNLAVGEEIKLD